MEQEAAQQQPKLAVYYDGNCPLCLKEIGFYQKCAGGEEINWIDANTATNDCLGDGLTQEQALSRLYARDQQGNLISGAKSFAAIWQALPAFKGIGWIAGHPLVQGILEPLYRVFLVFRPLIQKVFKALTKN